MSQRLITPSKVTAWLECPHYLTLESRAAAKLLTVERSHLGDFARLVMAKGLQHEEECLSRYRQEGRNILIVEKRGERTFQQWVNDVGNPFTGNHDDIVYQMPFIHKGIQGIADFVVKVINPETGTVSYEPVDAKLVRTEAKPGHVLQLCFYADAIRELTGADPQEMHILLASGETESLRVNEFRPYWNRLRGPLMAAVEAGAEADTSPKPCLHCKYCEFNPICEAQWREEDSLHFVAGIRKVEIEALISVGLPTLTQLAELVGVDEPVDGVRAERLKRLKQQAKLQRDALEQDTMPFSMAESEDDTTRWGFGLERLPESDDGDLFIDFEGDPLWRSDTGLFFLFGWLERDYDQQWKYRRIWAHDKESETAAADELISYIAHRRKEFPGMHAYHYNSTERTELTKLADGHPGTETMMANLVATGAFVDLYEVGLNAIQIGAESYGLKCMEKLTTYKRSHEIDQGAGAVVMYERYMNRRSDADLAAIAVYNKDDVWATMALRDWLVTHRPAEMEWRAPYLEPEPGRELDERVAALHELGGHAHFLGDLLGYWDREWQAYITPLAVKLAGSTSEELWDDPDSIVGLHSPGEFIRLKVNGEEKKDPAMRFSFPKSQVLEGFPPRGDALFISPDGRRRYVNYESLDIEAGTIDVVWGENRREMGELPTALTFYKWFRTNSKSEVLDALADAVLDGSVPDNVAMSLLRGDAPQFDGSGPQGGFFTSNLPELADLVVRLDRSFLAIQGPPGTGKTYSAARLVHAAIITGKRVGITAVAHRVVGNLLREVVKVFREEGDLDELRAVCNTDDPDSLPPEVEKGDNAKCGKSKFNLIAGTTFLFASKPVKQCPVEVLFVDEAGQMALADMLVVSMATDNLVMVGDPLQLSQVRKADHPRNSGCSALDHVLGQDETMPAERGVFLPVTRRMHPDVCEFISDQIYEGRLKSYSGDDFNCALQTTVAGTGLRWLPVSHTDNTTSSVEEADLIVAEILRLIGTEWTNNEGTTKSLGTKDFVVVTPYNDQQRLVTERLNSHTDTADIEVGTVDMFQGQEAAVVFFSMAASTGEDVSRGKDFLFSRNRLNVAISRARCLAYLVCTEELLNTRARNVTDMRLIATLNAFVEYAEQQNERSR